MTLYRRVGVVEEFVTSWGKLNWVMERDLFQLLQHTWIKIISRETEGAWVKSRVTQGVFEGLIWNGFRCKPNNRINYESQCLNKLAKVGYTCKESEMRGEKLQALFIFKTYTYNSGPSTTSRKAFFRQFFLCCKCR